MTDELYIARDIETGELATFLEFEDMAEFAQRGRMYSHEYFSIPIQDRFGDVERLFISKKDDLL